MSEREDEPLEPEEQPTEPVDDDEEEERWGGEESLGMLPSD